MLKQTTSKQLIKESIGLIKPDKKIVSLRNAVLIFPSLFLGIMASLNENTILIMKSNVSLVKDVLLAIWGIVFTGYALFQAFIGDEMLVKMLENTVMEGENRISQLQETNTLFAKVMMLCFIEIFISLLVIMIFGRKYHKIFCLHSR